MTISQLFNKANLFAYAVQDDITLQVQSVLNLELQYDMYI